VSTRPNIGLTGDSDTELDNYIQALKNAGAEPVILPQVSARKKAGAQWPAING